MHNKLNLGDVFDVRSFKLSQKMVRLRVFDLATCLEVVWCEDGLDLVCACRHLLRQVVGAVRMLSASWNGILQQAAAVNVYFGLVSKDGTKFHTLSTIYI